MLPIVLVIFVASSAFAAPSTVGDNLVEYNEHVDNGAPVSSFIVNGSFELIDGGDLNIDIEALKDSVADLANQRDPATQALAVSQLLATLGELATGAPRDSCAAANLVNTYAAATATGNYNQVGSALSQYVPTLLQDIDRITQLNANNITLRYDGGSNGNCAGGGRNYNFERAWSRILESSEPSQVPILNEIYNSSRRLYNAWNVRSNNVGAQATAASLRPVTEIVQQALYPLANFFKAVTTGNDASALAERAKQAIIQAAAVSSY